MCQCPHPCGNGVPCPAPVHAWLPASCFCSVGIPDPSFPACVGSLVPIPMSLGSPVPCLCVQGPLSPFPCHWGPQSPAWTGLPCPHPHSHATGVPVLFLPVLASLVPVTLGSSVPAHASFPCPRGTGPGAFPCSTCAQGVLSRGCHEGASAKPQCPLAVPTVGGDVGWDGRDAPRSLLGTPPCSLLCQRFNLAALSSV